MAKARSVASRPSLLIFRECLVLIEFPRTEPVPKDWTPILQTVQKCQGPAGDCAPAGPLYCASVMELVDTPALEAGGPPVIRRTAHVGSSPSAGNNAQATRPALGSRAFARPQKFVCEAWSMRLGFSPIWRMTYGPEKTGTIRSACSPLLHNAREKPPPRVCERLWPQGLAHRQGVVTHGANFDEQ